MLPLRYTRRWQGASVLLLLFVLAAALMPMLWFWGDRGAGLRWFQHADKFLHAMTFFVLTAWFTGMVARKRYLLVGVGLLAFGLAIEACQFALRYRSAEWNDVMANLSGIVAGLLVGIAGLGGWCQRIEARLLASQNSRP